MTTKQTGVATLPKTEQSAISQFSQTDIDIIKNSVAKNCTDPELKYFLAVAQTSGLNPFLKEIWCYKDGTGNIIIFAGRDGQLVHAKKHRDYKGIRSCAVCEKDTFDIDIPAGHVTHKFGTGPRGAIIGAYAFCFVDSQNPYLVWVDITTYDKKKFTWDTHKAAMIEKVAEAHVLDKAYPIGAAVNREDDYDFKNNTFKSPKTEDAEFTEIIPPEVPEVPEEIINAIADCKTILDCTAVYEGNTEWHTNSKFMQALGERKQAIKKGDKENVM